MKRGTLIRQYDAADCGAACLASVAAHYGLHIPISRIRQYAGTNDKGTSLRGLMDAAESMKLQSRGTRATADSLASVPLPAIFHFVLENDMQHFAVVYKIKKKKILLMDPAPGKWVWQPVELFKKNWTGIMLLLAPAEDFSQANEKQAVIVRFWQLVQPHRSMLLQALTGAFVYTILGLATSIYVQKIIDFVLPDGNKHLLNLLSVIMIVILCFQIVAGYVKSLIVIRTGQQIDARLILGYYKHLLNLPQRFFDSMRVGEIISRVNDAVRIRVFINDVAISVIVYALTIVLTIGAMFMYNWKLALIMLFVLPVYALIYWISNRVNAKWQRRLMENSAALETQLVESVQGIASIRRFNVQSFFNLKTENRFAPLMRTIYDGSHAGLKLSNATEWITGFVTIMILWMGADMVMDRQLSPGELISFYTLTAFFTSPVQALMQANKPMQEALIAADRLFDIIDLETENECGQEQIISYLPKGDLLFRNIHFGYSHGNDVFNGLDICIAEYRMTAITGESGSGKSTLLSLLQRIYHPARGNILIGGMDIRYISTPILRQRIGTVPQKADLFQGSMISNIALGDPNPDMTRIFNICSRLGLHEFIDKLPLQYETVIREQGDNLSGGQKQRFAIARALYRDPDILILDEATSGLDTESERKVMETIRWFTDQRKTVVFITHRLSAIKCCDSIIFLKKEGPAVCGLHQTVLAENEAYKSMFQMD